MSAAPEASSLPWRWDRADLILNPRDPAFVQNPYPAYASMHGHGSIFRWRDLGCLAACGHPIVASILRDRRFGRILPTSVGGRPDRSGMSERLQNFRDVERHSLLELEGPAHSRIRGLVLRAFVSRQVERMAPRVEALANEFIDRFAAHGRVELVAGFASLLPVTVIAELIGVDTANTARLLDWSHRMVAMYQFGRTREVEDDADRAAAEFRGFVLAEIATKRRRPGADLLSELIRAETADGRLTEDEMVSTVILLMNAGHEATVHQLGNGAKTLLEAFGSGAASLFADEASATRTVEELLRYDPPLHLFKRVALEDVTWPGGFSLRRGEEIALLLGAANRDPSVYVEPDRFDPSRTGPPSVSFGAGVHFCVGAPLARLELRTALALLFERLPNPSIVTRPRYRDSWHFHGLERLDLRFHATPVKA